MEHIVILKEKYYDAILNGSKKIESRWSIHKIVPYEMVNINDTLLLKKTGCDITATCVVKDVKYFKLDDKVLEAIENKYASDICMSSESFKGMKNKKYCTLVWVDNVKEITPIKVKRSYGSAWIVKKF